MLLSIGAIPKLLIRELTGVLMTDNYGLSSFSTLYGFSWTAYAIAGAAGPVIMGRAFDVTGSYQNLLTILAALTLAAGCLMFFLPEYREPAGTAELSSPVSSAAVEL
jgi:MFS family permease